MAAASLPAAVAACCGVAAAYVGSLYVWPAHPGGRQHPEVIARRAASVAAVSALAWLPAAALNAAATAAGRGAQGPAAATTRQLLGLRISGAPAAAALPLAAVALLFLGPLVHLAASAEARAAHPLAAAIRAAAGGGAAAGAARFQIARDLLIAPVSEEWVFRACLVPLLWLAGLGRRAVVLFTPLFFGAAHLHHLRELVTVQGLPLRPALASVLFQFAFTTVFGWLATWVFLSTGHAFAPALVHAACNAVGVPPFGEMRRARLWGQPVLWWATAAGVALFWRLSGALLRPEHYSNRVYAGA
ncbi:hypothetical protein Rsub_08401 [Raphidocelis subcapitata]|uniref:intramembrane prenyl-peptidase Rce1 n=1 Tax=Raphidocelis subcapitata TaxID=307507 RepID=A0A2V0P796_9CHLO|nr:hypothetical protein Rsub_08401 [Raphidocelis subcapitata]|eukprot:GBF95439.1 hypothetical protein Rsub_08401 [Raphidocelis subcapitata]